MNHHINQPSFMARACATISFRNVSNGPSKPPTKPPTSRRSSCWPCQKNKRVNPTQPQPLPPHHDMAPVQHCQLPPTPKVQLSTTQLRPLSPPVGNTLPAVQPASSLIIQPWYYNCNITFSQDQQDLVDSN